MKNLTKCNVLNTFALEIIENLTIIIFRKIVSLVLASTIPVLGLEKACPRKVCPWPWNRIFFDSLALVLASNLVSSIPPLMIGFFLLFRIWDLGLETFKRSKKNLYWHGMKNSEIYPTPRKLTEMPLKHRMAKSFSMFAIHFVLITIILPF